MTDKLCGNCMCFTLYNQQNIGRCRKYNITVQLQTHCINQQHWKCKCLIQNCTEKIKGGKNNELS